MDLIVICFSVTSQESLEAAKQWLPILLQCAPYTPVILVCNISMFAPFLMLQSRQEIIRTNEKQLQHRRKKDTSNVILFVAFLVTKIAHALTYLLGQNAIKEVGCV